MLMANGEALYLKGNKDAEVLKGDSTSATGCVKRRQGCIKWRWKGYEGRRGGIKWEGVKR